MDYVKDALSTVLQKDTVEFLFKERELIFQSMGLFYLFLYHNEVYWSIYSYTEWRNISANSFKVSLSN